VGDHLEFETAVEIEKTGHATIDCETCKTTPPGFFNEPGFLEWRIWKRRETPSYR
jgi:hypothetical protein